jgi:tetratricopeptide (TPR) repeat protein
MKKLSAILSLLSLGNFCFSQNHQQDFNYYYDKNDTLKQREILTKWENENPTDPELFTSYFNYYFSKAKQETIILTQDLPEGQSFKFADSLGNTAGFFGSKINYDASCLQKGFEKIDEGIKLYPDRLDMRFGKIYVLGQIKNWKDFTNEIVKAVKYSEQNNNQWKWTNNEMQKDGKSFFLSSIQDYQVQLFNTGNDSLLPYMQKIASEILAIYPDHIESLSNLSVTYLLTGEYVKGIDILLKAEKLNPKDAIVLGNIAQGYKLKGDKNKAIEYYKKTMKYGDKETKKYAKEQIKKLK